MKLYIAASSNPTERPRVDAAFALVAPYVDIVGDWRADVDAHGANPEQDARSFALKDVEAIRDAHAIWVLAPESVTRGLWFEFGIAVQRGRSIDSIVSGNHAQSIFCALADKRFATDVEAALHIANTSSSHATHRWAAQ